MLAAPVGHGRGHAAAADGRATALRRDGKSRRTPQVEVIGIGGLPGGSVRIGLDSDPTVEVIAPVGSDGSFTATVGTGATFGPQTLKLIQRAPGSSCVVPTAR